MSWLMDDEDDEDDFSKVQELKSSPVVGFRPASAITMADTPLRIDSPEQSRIFARKKKAAASPYHFSSSPGHGDGLSPLKSRTRFAPKSPIDISMMGSDLDDELEGGAEEEDDPIMMPPPPTFIPGRQKRRRTLLDLQSSSPIEERPAGRLLRKEQQLQAEERSEMPAPKPKAQSKAGHKPNKVKGKSKKSSKIPRNAFVLEAAHSGGEVSEGSEGSVDIEDESDRRFAGDFEPTQAPAGYNQALAYRQGQLTQAPLSGPAFSKGAARAGRFGRGSMSNRRRPDVSSSPPPAEDHEPNEYAFGSFIVRDEEEIVYESDAESD